MLARWLRVRSSDAIHRLRPIHAGAAALQYLDKTYRPRPLASRLPDHATPTILIVGDSMDPIFGTVGAAALTQGVAFLYAQTGELLKRRREARDTARQHSDKAAASTPALEPPVIVFAHPESAAPVGLQAVEDNLGDLREAREALEQAVTTRGGELRTDEERLALAQLRATVERIYAVDLTFVGEDRARDRDQVHHSRTVRAKTVKTKYFAMGDISGVTE